MSFLQEKLYFVRRYKYFCCKKFGLFYSFFCFTPFILELLWLHIEYSTLLSAFTIPSKSLCTLYHPRWKKNRGRTLKVLPSYRIVPSHDREQVLTGLQTRLGIVQPTSSGVANNLTETSETTEENC